MFVLIYTYIYKYIFIYNEYRYVYIIFVFQGIIYDTCCNYLSVEFFLPIFTYFVLWSILNQKISKILKNLNFEKFMPKGVKRYVVLEHENRFWKFLAQKLHSGSIREYWYFRGSVCILWAILFGIVLRVADYKVVPPNHKLLNAINMKC